MGKAQKTQNESTRYLTIPAAAKLLGLSPHLLREQAKREAVPTYSVGSSWPRVRITDIEDWVRSTRVRATSHARARVAEIFEREASRQ
jgi:hypothetical protein